ncbi:MAG: hypothetical protein ACI9AT_000416 [Ulvibacter sp.]|jgi:hypothetical protein
MARKTFEWWAIDKHGNKYHEYETPKSSRTSKVKSMIEKKYGFNILECLDFGIRQVE